MPDEAVVDRIRETKPLALLVTSMFSTEQQMVDDMASEVKKAYPHLPIIAGGIHATVQQDWTLESGNIDFVVLGEGEETAVELLRKIQSEGAVAVKQKGQIIKQRSPIQDLDRYWAIEEVLLRDGEYRYNDRASRRGQTYTHLTQPDWTRTFSLYYSRGCPVHCDYCASSEKDGTKIRHMGSERMFSEFRLLHERYGIQIFYNQADTFGFHREDIELLRMIKEYRKEDPEFVVNNPNAFFVRIFFPRSKNYELDEELLDLFAGGGFNVMTIAIETFNPRFNKKIDFEKIPQEKIKGLFQAIHDRGMMAEAYMMYAFPDQTLEELKHDERMVQSLPYLDEVAWQNCMIFPGTTYYTQGLNKGWFTEKAYREHLRQGYFFHRMPDTFNFSRIQLSDLLAFREHHLPNIIR